VASDGIIAVYPRGHTLRDHLVPQRAKIAGGRAQVGRPLAARSLVIIGAVLVACALAIAPMPARAASVLSNGDVAPTTGPKSTVFSFSVDYASSNPTRNAQAVWAEVGSVTVALGIVSGNPHDGTWEGTSKLPVGTWQVTFHASTAQDPQPAPLDGPTITVTKPQPTPTPSPTPRPTATPSPTPRPTATATATPAAPTPTAAATAPPGSTPRPAAPGPQATSLPDGDDGPTSAASPSMSAGGTGDVLSGTDGPHATGAPDENSAPVELPDASDPAAAAADDQATPRIPLLAPLLMVGGTLSIAGAAVLGRQWYVTRRGRRP
jgi:hypothetical protein